MQQDVQRVLRRSLTDEDFLDAMLRNPRQALREYELTDEERGVLEGPDRDLIALMRIAGEGRQIRFLFLNLDITLDIDLTEFITSLHLDITIDLATAELDQQQEQARAGIAKMARSIQSMRAGADRLEQIQQMLQTLSGATELVRRSALQDSDG
jgi:hypothetical protein